MSLRLALWNVQWAGPTSFRGLEIRRLLQDSASDIICLTEGYTGLFPDGGFEVHSSPDYGYSNTGGKRKVLLWSRWPWTGVDRIGSSALPSGRFVRGSVATPMGQITVIGVCVPWAHAHVTTGRRDRRPWEDHLACLNGLEEILRAENRHTNLILTGDFNQRLPISRAPKAMRECLLTIIANLTVCTAGPIADVGEHSIDHLACSTGLVPAQVKGWARTGANNQRLSDHIGICVDLDLKPWPPVASSAPWLTGTP